MKEGGNKPPAEKAICKSQDKTFWPSKLKEDVHWFNFNYVLLYAASMTGNTNNLLCSILKPFSMFSISFLNGGSFIHEPFIRLKCKNCQLAISCEAGEQEIVDVIEKFVP